MTSHQYLAQAHLHGDELEDAIFVLDMKKHECLTSNAKTKNLLHKNLAGCQCKAHAMDECIVAGPHCHCHCRGAVAQQQWSKLWQESRNRLCVAGRH
jgi:hypothetical protein